VLAEGLVAQNIAFGIIAAMMIFGALRVVTSRNVVHAALWLVCVLAGAAAQYLLLYAEFVAVTQVLVYVGAVTVLFLFGVMLTRARIGRESDLNNKNWLLGIPVALVLLAAMSLPPQGLRRRDAPQPRRLTACRYQTRQRHDLQSVPLAVLGLVVRSPRRGDRRHRARQEGLTRC